MSEITIENESRAARQEIFALLIAHRGMTPAEAGASPDVAISAATAYRWMKDDRVRSLILEELRTTRIRIQTGAAKHVDAALRTLHDALSSPGMTPTQVNAAKALLAYAGGSEALAQAGTTIHVEVNTGLNVNAAAEQAERARLYTARKEAIDVPYEVIEDAAASSED